MIGRKEREAAAAGKTAARDGAARERERERGRRGKQGAAGAHETAFLCVQGNSGGEERRAAYNRSRVLVLGEVWWVVELGDRGGGGQCGGVVYVCCGAKNSAGGAGRKNGALRFEKVQGGKQTQGAAWAQHAACAERFLGQKGHRGQGKADKPRSAPVVATR